MYNIELISGEIYQIPDHRIEEFKKAIFAKNKRFVNLKEDLVAIHQIKIVRKIKEQKNEIKKYLETNTEPTEEGKKYLEMKKKWKKNTY